MSNPDTTSVNIQRALAEQNLPGVTSALAPLPVDDAIEVLERLGMKQRALAYRLLPKDRALEVFEGLDAALQSEIVQGLKDEEVASVFAEMDPDDRVTLLDELPASVATRLLQGLPAGERDLTAAVLGYPQGSIGRRMSPEYVTTHPDLTVAQTLDRVWRRVSDAETIYTVPVLAARKLVGVVSLRDLMSADGEVTV